MLLILCEKKLWVHMKGKMAITQCLKTQNPLFLVPAWYYAFWRKQYVFVVSISI